ncbi:MAG TPA: endonuclease MutS2 [Clostridia bacterium]|nr:MAG: Endonuclease MutS2 [Firmicutes bacterium ADurb.Bin248]HOG00787.1 endonuclease MutS2 [Clostridia bacterium]HOS18211.1 endonuclease MutS2 [Clostridia bacterium]
MQQRVLKTLEYDKIRAMLRERASCCVSRERVDTMEPTNVPEEAERMLALTAEAETHLFRSGRSPVDDFPDMRECLARIRAALFVTPKELLGIASCLRAARVTRETLTKDGGEGLLFNMASFLTTHRSLEEEINRCIVSEDEIFDGASPALSRIRRSMRLANDRVREKLNAMIRSSTYQKYLQEPLITIRNGRFVIPVKQEYRQNVPGLIHDQSGSGATLFIEPAAVVELGNEYKKLLAEEAEEIERILTELTAMLAPYADEIREDLCVLGDIDLAFAKARLGREMRAVRPKLNGTGYVRVVKGRHPLIDPDKVVPVDIWLGREFRSLIITGPNTGGKTVTLKIVGLFALMAQSGLFLPADEGSEFAVFGQVFADIGDEQSIEQSLSTFSSHMTNIVSILRGADENSLVLLDELGAGTDPIEGAALAMSILEELHARRAVCVSTTHYSEIKAFALTHEGMENASMQFDIERLAPTYRLYIGIPGKSNAFEISERLGLPASIIESAKGYLKGEDVRFEDIISSAESQHRLAEEERQMAAAARLELEKLRAEAERERKKLDEDRNRLQAKAREDAKKLVADTKRELEKLIVQVRALKDIDRSAADRAIQQSRDALRAQESAIAETVELKKEDAGEPPRSVKPGDAVKIITLDQKATVLAPPDPKGEVLVQAGIMKLSVKLEDLRLEKAAEPKAAFARVGLAAGRHVGLELDVRGMLVEEATLVVERYLDDAYSAGLSEVNIIHGKGTGALRAGIQDFLKREPLVKSFRIGNYGEGDAGVTVVTLKKA